MPCCHLCVKANLLATGGSASEVSIPKLHLGSCIGDWMLSSAVAEVYTAKQVCSFTKCNFTFLMNKKGMCNHTLKLRNARHPAFHNTGAGGTLFLSWNTAPCVLAVLDTVARTQLLLIQSS